MTGFLFGLGLGVLGVFLWMMRTHASLRTLVSDRHLEALVAAWSDVCRGAPAVTFLGVGLSRQGSRLHATLARGVPTVGLPWVAAVVAELAALPSPEGGLLVETHGRRALSLAAPDLLPPAPTDLSRLREAAANRMKSMRLVASR
jgi:hypothetical protein